MSNQDAMFQPPEQANEAHHTVSLTPWQLVAIIIGAIIIIAALSSFINMLFSFFGSVLVVAAVAVALYFAWKSNTVPVELPLRRFTALEQPTVVIHNPAGNIRIRGAAVSDVEIRGTQRILRTSYQHIVPSTLNCRCEGNTVTVIIDRKWENEMMEKGSVDLDIIVPAVSDLHVHGNAGEIRLRNIVGQVVIETNAGNIDVQEATFRRTSTLRTNAGAINFEGILDPPGCSHFETNAGNISASLSRSSSIAITAKTDLGTIHNEFGGDIIGAEPHASLALRTNLGSIYISAR
jgi:hypothetical protein